MSGSVNQTTGGGPTNPPAGTASTAGAPAVAPLRVLITGFAPFDGLKSNPSDTIGRKVSQMPVDGVEFSYRELDVSENAVDDFMSDVTKQQQRPDIILSLGLHTPGQIEVDPQNYMGTGMTGEEHAAGPILPGHPEELPTAFPVPELEAALSRVKDRTIGSPDHTMLPGIPYRPDHDGGICNYLDYRETDAFGTGAGQDGTLAGFVHVGTDTKPEEVLAIVKVLKAYKLSQQAAATEAASRAAAGPQATSADLAGTSLAEATSNSQAAQGVVSQQARLGGLVTGGTPNH